MADIDKAAAQEDVSSALDGIKDSVAAFTYDGDRTLQDHLSGAPEERDLVLGDDDPRDAGLAERPLTEDVVWTGRIFNVDRLQVQLPDGRTAIRDVVRHPGAVAIVALTDEGRICLVRQYRTALGRVTVEIPAGKLDPGEDPLEPRASRGDRHDRREDRLPHHHRHLGRLHRRAHPHLHGDGAQLLQVQPRC